MTKLQFYSELFGPLTCASFYFATNANKQIGFAYDLELTTDPVQKKNELSFRLYNFLSGQDVCFS